MPNDSVLIDFDVDSHGNYFVLLNRNENTGIINLSNKTISVIENPCLNASISKQSRFTIGCDNSIYVVCASESNTAIKVYQEGIAKYAYQLDLFQSASIKSMQIFDDVLLIKDNQRILMYNATNRAVISEIEFAAYTDDNLTYSQVYLDQEQNVISAQNTQIDFEIQIVTSIGSTANIKLDNWNECISSIAWRKLLFTLCKHSFDDNWALLSFDYLK